MATLHVRFNKGPKNLQHDRVGCKNKQAKTERLTAREEVIDVQDECFHNGANCSCCQHVGSETMRTSIQNRQFQIAKNFFLIVLPVCCFVVVVVVCFCSFSDEKQQQKSITRSHFEHRLCID